MSRHDDRLLYFMYFSGAYGSGCYNLYGMKGERIMKKEFIKILSVGCMAALLLAACGKSDNESDGGAKQEISPELTDQSQTPAGDDNSDKGRKFVSSFTAKDLDGNTVTEAIFEEKDLTVVNIWGTFCPPCIGEMPKLGEWAESMPENVQLVGLIVDIAGDDDTEHHDLAVEITEKAGADFLQIIANADFIEVLSSVVGVPTTYFVDKNGCVAGEPIIGADVEGYKKFVEDYLNGQ